MALSQWLRRWVSTENRDKSEGTKPLVSESEKAEHPSRAQNSAVDVRSSSQKEHPGVQSTNEEASDDKVTERYIECLIARHDTVQFFEELTNKLQSPAFLERLENKDHSGQSGPPPSTSQEEETADDDSEETFVWVTKEDAMEGLVETIAQCILSCPEADQIRPHELQDAIVTACKDLQKSKARTTWGWLKFIYRAASWSYSAFSFYTNPWILRAILVALCSVPNLLGRFFF